MRRRDFIAGLGASVATWPLAARAQQAAMPVVGYLNSGALELGNHEVQAFRKGLSEIGYVEGRNIAIEYRWANNDDDRLPELVDELVRRRVSVIATLGSGSAVLTAKASTTIPVVFGTGSDPIQAGFVTSFSRPGGTITGITTMNQELGSKRLGLLRELVPNAMRIAVLVPRNPLVAELQIKDAEAAASAIGRQIEIFPAGTNRDIDTAFASMVQKRADALVVGPNTLFRNSRVQLVTLAAHHSLPAIYPFREDAQAGGLMSYGSSVTEVSRLTALYVGRILKGEKPADLPIIRATKFELVINVQTAKALGIEVPPKLLAIADEVIE